MPPVVASYREFAPGEALKRHVRAFFSFVPGIERPAANSSRRPIVREALFTAGDLYCPPAFADGHASIVFNLGVRCRADGGWQPDPAGRHGYVVGAVSRADPVCVERPAMVGAYFLAAQLPSFTSIPAYELANQTVALADVWGVAASTLSMQFAEIHEARRIDALESALLGRMEDRGGSHSAVDVPRLVTSVVRRRGRVTVERLAGEAGVSRQHLARLFRESIGISPKLYCRLARFQSGLIYAGCGKDVDWSQAALDLGYSDQSHMIAEFREFSGLTPHALARDKWFHPFIEWAKSAERVAEA